MSFAIHAMVVFFVLSTSCTECFNCAKIIVC